MPAYKAVAVWISIIIVMMLTLNIKINKQSNSPEELETDLIRKRRAVGTKPRHVLGVCGGSSYGRNGWLASPNFPGSSYPSLSSCEWTIIVYPRMVIQFDFVYMDMEDAPAQKRGGCTSDYIIIRESKNENSSLVGGQRYCGFDTTFPSVYTKSNRAYVSFKSDHSKEFEGFAIRWKAVAPLKPKFDCDFESVKDLCAGWEQSNDDDYDWTTHNGPTQSGKSSATGPTKDRTKQNEYGVYLYTEASGVKKGQKAVLLSPYVRITEKNGQCVRFWYHMRGETMGTLNVYQKEIISDTNSTKELVFSKSGEQSKNWRRADINVTASNNKRQFIFEGIRGSSYKSDMAIDDIQLLKRPCPVPWVYIPTTKSPVTRPLFARTRGLPPPTRRATRRPTTTRRSRPTTTPFSTTTRGDCYHFCKGVGNCVQREYFCDGIPDCLHREDESDCSTKADVTTPAPNTSEWDDWASWSRCSVTCGGGRSERERKCIRGGPFDCIGSSSEGIECNTQRCLNWNEWQEWSGCSRTCGNGGVRMRSRTCNGGNIGQPGCIGPYIEVDFCNQHNCPKWSNWAQWSACQATCGNGTKSRARTCQGDQEGEPGCIGNATEITSCTNQVFPNCGDWTKWTGFSECTRSCGTGRRMRSRQCRYNGVISQGCPGSRTDEETCNTISCAEWTEWKPYTQCSVTCGNGVRSKTRKCMQDGVESQRCSGKSRMDTECSFEPCKDWAQWAPWSKCTASCGTGFHGRRRLCWKGEVRSVGCSGNGIETGRCNTSPCPTCQIFCALLTLCRASSWSKWSQCSVTCGEGKMVRRRPCDVFELGCDNGEYVEQTKPCELTPCGGLHCFDGISASIGGFETINTFSLRKCEDIAHAPSSRDPNGRAGLFCAITIMKVERNGMKFDMMQGTCLNEDLCSEVNCNRYKKLMGIHNIEACEVRCCGKDRCNDPEQYKSRKDDLTNATDPCSENPCQNGGSCIAMTSVDSGYICACPSGFTGLNCTEDSHTICHTGVSTRTADVPVATEMLTTTCESPNDKCMVASLASYVEGIPMYVDTALCVKADVCDKLKCSDLKKTTKQYEIASCKIHCCSDDYCNNAPTKIPPLPTTAAYSVGTVRATTKRPKPTRPTTRKPSTRRVTPKTTASTTTESTTVDTSGPHWSQWQKWQSCTHACGASGTRRRYRYCMKGAPGMPGCMPQSADHEIVPCNTGVSCIRWREWGNWQSCSRTCGGGNRERRRSCDGGATNTGDCIGSDIERENCNDHSCTTTTTTTTTTRPPTTPKQNTPRWSNWTQWKACSTRCGLGTRQRRRVCIGGRIGRRGCRGKVKQTEDCNEGPCTTATTTTATTAKKPRGWGLWTDWSSCTVSCGKGTETRTRECHGTKPGKKGCRGKKKDTQTCQSSCPEPTPIVLDAKCFDRNVGKAKKAGRKCPAKCAMDEDCQQEKKCVCDGLCGKTCQNPSKRCRDIASDVQKASTRISCSAGNSVGSVCTYSCQTGYKLKGSPNVICQGTSKWTNEKNLPTCTASTPSEKCDKKRPNHNDCCGKRSYNSRSAKCCNGQVSPGGKAATKCCSARPYDPKKRGCCKEKVFWISKQMCQNGRVVKK